jgi:hypothetical protein
MNDLHRKKLLGYRIDRKSLLFNDDYLYKTTRSMIDSCKNFINPLYDGSQNVEICIASKKKFKRGGLHFDGEEILQYVISEFSKDRFFEKMAIEGLLGEKNEDDDKIANWKCFMEKSNGADVYFISNDQYRNFYWSSPIAVKSIKLPKHIDLMDWVLDQKDSWLEIFTKIKDVEKLFSETKMNVQPINIDPSKINFRHAIKTDQNELIIC